MKDLLYVADYLKMTRNDDESKSVENLEKLCALLTAMDEWNNHLKDPKYVIAESSEELAERISKITGLKKCFDDLFPGESLSDSQSFLGKFVATISSSKETMSKLASKMYDHFTEFESGFPQQVVQSGIKLKLPHVPKLNSKNNDASQSDVEPLQKPSSNFYLVKDEMFAGHLEVVGSDVLVDVGADADGVVERYFLPYMHVGIQQKRTRKDELVRVLDLIKRHSDIKKDLYSWCDFYEKMDSSYFAITGEREEVRTTQKLLYAKLSKPNVELGSTYPKVDFDVLFSDVIKSVKTNEENQFKGRWNRFLAAFNGKFFKRSTIASFAIMKSRVESYKSTFAAIKAIIEKNESKLDKVKNLLSKWTKKSLQDLGVVTKNVNMSILRQFYFEGRMQTEMPNLFTLLKSCPKIRPTWNTREKLIVDIKKAWGAMDYDKVKKLAKKLGVEIPTDRIIDLKKSAIEQVLTEVGVGVFGNDNGFGNSNKEAISRMSHDFVRKIHEILIKGKSGFTDKESKKLFALFKKNNNWPINGINSNDNTFYDKINCCFRIECDMQLSSSEDQNIFECIKNSLDPVKNKDITAEAYAVLCKANNFLLRESETSENYDAPSYEIWGALTDLLTNINKIVSVNFDSKVITAKEIFTKYDGYNDLKAKSVKVSEILKLFNNKEKITEVLQRIKDTYYEAWLSKSALRNSIYEKNEPIVMQKLEDEAKNLGEKLNELDKVKPRKGWQYTLLQQKKSWSKIRGRVSQEKQAIEMFIGLVEIFLGSEKTMIEKINADDAMRLLGIVNDGCRGPYSKIKKKLHPSLAAMKKLTELLTSTMLKEKAPALLRVLDEHKKDGSIKYIKARDLDVILAYWKKKNYDKVKKVAEKMGVDIPQSKVIDLKKEAVREKLNEKESVTLGSVEISQLSHSLVKKLHDAFFVQADEKAYEKIKNNNKEFKSFLNAKSASNVRVKNDSNNILVNQMGETFKQIDQRSNLVAQSVDGIVNSNAQINLEKKAEVLQSNGNESVVSGGSNILNNSNSVLSGSRVTEEYHADNNSNDTSSEQSKVDTKEEVIAKSKVQNCGDGNAATGDNGTMLSSKNSEQTKSTSSFADALKMGAGRLKKTNTSNNVSLVVQDNQENNTSNDSNNSGISSISTPPPMFGIGNSNLVNNNASFSDGDADSLGTSAKGSIQVDIKKIDKGNERVERANLLADIRNYSREKRAITPTPSSNGLFASKNETHRRTTSAGGRCSDSDEGRKNEKSDVVPSHIEEQLEEQLKKVIQSRRKFIAPESPVKNGSNLASTTNNENDVNSCKGSW